MNSTKAKIIFVFFSLITLLSQATFSQPLQWTKQFTGNLPSLSLGYDMTTDATGNVYVVGHFRGNINFGNGNVSANGYLDFFFAKYNSNGVLQWVNRIGSPNTSVSGIGATVSNVGGTVFLFVSGIFTSTNGQILTINFDPANSPSGNLTIADTNGDAFVAKYNLSTGGSFVWAKRVDNSDSNELAAGKMAVDASGNAYHVNTVAGEASMRKYGVDGSLLWTTSIGDVANDISFRNNTVFVVGRGLGPSNKPLVWFDQNGSLLGSKGNTNYGFTTIALDNTTGIYLGGFQDLPGSFIGVIEKYTTTSTNPVWSRTSGLNLNAFKMDIGLAGTNQSEVIAAGWFAGTVNFNNGIGNNYTITSSGNGAHDNIFAVRYNSNTGDCLWVRNNSSNTANGNSNPIAIATDNSSFSILGSVFARTIDADFCVGTVNIIADNADNGYVAKYLIETGNSFSKIIGGNLVCESGASYSLINTPGGSTATWSATPSNFFVVSSGAGKNVNLSAASGASGNASVTFFITNSCGAPLQPVTKLLWVGVPYSTVDMSYNLMGDVPSEICASQGYPGEFYTYTNPFSTQYFEWESDAGDFLLTNPSYLFHGNNTTSNYLYFLNYEGVYSNRTIRVRAANSCGLSSWITRSFDLTISSECQGGMGLSMYPNPSSDYVDVTLLGTNPEKELLDFEYTLEIYDWMGNKKFEAMTNKRTSRIALNSLSKGTYHLKAHLKDKFLSQRIYVE